MLINGTSSTFPDLEQIGKKGQYVFLLSFPEVGKIIFIISSYFSRTLIKELLKPLCIIFSGAFESKLKIKFFKNSFNNSLLCSPKLLNFLNGSGIDVKGLPKFFLKFHDWECFQVLFLIHPYRLKK